MEQAKQVPDENASRLQRLCELRDLIGSGIWEGDLTEMREDQPPFPHPPSTQD